MNKKKHFLVIAAAVTAQVFWGFSFMASRIALNEADVVLVLSHRFLLAFAVMSLLPLTGLIPLRLKGKPVLLVVLMGLAEPVIYFFGEQYGILHSTTIFSGVMIAMIPIVCTLAAGPLLKEHPAPRQLLFGALSVTGVAGMGLISRNQGTLDWIGVVSLVIAVVSACAYTLLSRGISDRFTAFERSYMVMGLGAVVFTCLALAGCKGELSAYLRPLANSSYLISILFLALCCSGLAYFLSAFALTHLPVAQATVFLNLTTAVSVFAGTVFLHEPLTWMGLLCCAAILVGIYGVQRSSPKED